MFPESAPKRYMDKSLSKEIHDKSIKVYTIAQGGVELEMVSRKRSNKNPDDIIQQDAIVDVVVLLLVFFGLHNATLNH